MLTRFICANVYNSVGNNEDVTKVFKVHVNVNMGRLHKCV